MPRESAPRDPAVSDFVRIRIREWADTGRELQELARIAGVAKSMPSQVLRGLGVGGRSLPGFAKAFGFGSTDALQRAAYEWYLAQSGAAEEMSTPAVAAARQYALDLQQGTEAQIRTILSRYTHPDFRARDAEWWTETLLKELRLDRRAMNAAPTGPTKEQYHEEMQEAVEAKRRAAAPAPPTRRKATA